jgi:O-antigen/teichoic acid export membrane protein
VSLRVLARSSALYTIGNLAPKLGAFVLLPILLRFLTRSEYGVISLLTTLSGLLTLILTFGMDGALMRLHFDLQGRSRATLYSTLTIFTLGSSAAIVAVFAAILGPFFPALFAGIEFYPLGLLSLLIALTSSIQYVPSVLFRATGNAGAFLLYNLGMFALSSLAIVGLVVASLGAAGVLIGQLVGDIMALAVAIALIFSFGRPSFSRQRLAQALRFGLPLVPHGISVWVLRLSDRWLIALLIGLPVLEAQAAIGVYSFAYQLGAVIGLIVVSFNSAWSPYFFRIGDRPTAPVLYRHVTTLVMAGLLALAVGMSALAPEVVTVVATAKYAQATDVIPIVAFASVFQGLYTMLVTLVFFMKRTAWLPLITIASAALNVGLNLLLIPALGMIGAAWSTLAGFAFLAAVTGLYARGLYPVRLDVPRLAVLGVSALAATLLSRLVDVPSQAILQALVHAGVGIAFVAVASVVALGPVRGLRQIARATDSSAGSA